MDPAFDRPQTARASTQYTAHRPAPPPPQLRSGSAAPRRLAYAEPPAWAKQSWEGRRPAAASPRKAASRLLGCENTAEPPLHKNTRDGALLSQLLSAAAAAAAGHEPAAVRLAQSKLVGGLVLSEQEIAMMIAVASPRAAASPFATRATQSPPQPQQP